MTYCDSPAQLLLQALDGSGNVARRLDLMDAVNGYRVASLDVAYPTVRESVSARPTRDGDYDVSSLYGPRLVTVTGSLVPSSSGSRQMAMQELAWWCQPRLRPRLYYAYDADTGPQFLTLRGSALSAPASNPAVSDFTVSWVAPNPIAQGAAHATTLAPGTSVAVSNNGTYRAWPVFRVHGPCPDPVITWDGGGCVAISGYTVASGHFVDIDTNAQSCQPDGSTDPNDSLYQHIDFTQTNWAGFEPFQHPVVLFSASSGSLDVSWLDAFI